MRKHWYEKTIPLSIEDIAISYRDAANKQTQIQILADICGTRKERIAWLLKEAGYEVDSALLPCKPKEPNAPNLDAIWRGTPSGIKAKRYRELYRNNTAAGSTETKPAARAVCSESVAIYRDEYNTRYLSDIVKEAAEG